MKTYLNLAKAILVLEVKNLVSGFFGYIAFLDLADLDLKKDSTLIILFSSLLPSLTFLMILPLLVNTNLLAKKPLTMVLSIKINGVAIRLKP